jgi:protein ImuA
VQAHQSQIVLRLKNDLLKLEGVRAGGIASIDSILGPLRDSFPCGGFPAGAVHEFLFNDCEDSAATAGFISRLLSALMQNSGIAFWISCTNNIFPPSLKTTGIEPHRVVFVDLQTQKEVVWAMDEALKCSALSSVVGEVRELDFTASRRMQLAAEQSGVTCFVLRKHREQQKITPTASVSRWKVGHLSSVPIDGLPGIGHPQWKVELLRIRNGRTGSWNLMWSEGGFQNVRPPATLHEEQRKAG